MTSGDQMTESSQATSFSWRKSSYSVIGSCVEVGTSGETVLVRDSVTVNSPVLQMPSATWQTFIAAIDG